MRALWVDASAGASGDMLLGALVGAGVPVGVIGDAVDKVAPGQVALTHERVQRGGLAATRCHVAVADQQPERTWGEVERIINEAGLHEDVRALAHDVFDRLAHAEGHVHGVAPAEVHFHEVGALDALADVIGVCAGWVHLGLPRTASSPVAVGGGTTTGAHGRLPVPAPAVVELLRGLPTVGGPVEMETCTPTGAALLATLADDWGPQPAMTVEVVGVGAGTRDPDGHANLTRLFVGSTADTTADPRPAVVLETNVDDLDPRVWPGVLTRLLEVGASDAWLTPILMKKGRPAHTLHVLVVPGRAERVRHELFRHTSTLGVREVAVGKHELDRRLLEVDVDGHRVTVKLGVLGGEVVTAQPEFDDVVAAAAALGRPQRQVLAEAAAAARGRLAT